MNFKKRVNGSWTDVPHYIAGTDTETITTLPATIYPLAQTATLGLKGNTVQNGTPTSSSPIQPSECGERTGNLLDADIYYGTYKQADGTYQSTRANLYNVPIKPFKADDIGKTFTFVADISPITGNARLCAIINGTIVSGSNTEKSVVTFTVETADDSIFFNYGSGSTTVTTLSEIMLVQGSTAPTSYIPWGIKIPISSANTTTPVYLGEVETTRRVKKLVLTGEEEWQIYMSTSSTYRVSISNIPSIGNPAMCSHFVNSPLSQIASGKFTVRSTWIYIRYAVVADLADFKAYLAAQYANGTPVTVWYVLATEQTGIVNEPLMRIGSYADTLSNVSIPVTAGGDTLSVGTTVQPSEVTVNYKGWHPAIVHERTNGAWA